jgi:hypothetical protein
VIAKLENLVGYQITVNCCSIYTDTTVLPIGVLVRYASNEFTGQSLTTLGVDMKVVRKNNYQWRDKNGTLQTTKLVVQLWDTGNLSISSDELQ